MVRRTLTVCVVALLALAACEPAHLSSDPERRGPRVVVPDAIDATGATPVGEALNDFLADVADDAVVVFPADARYRVETSVMIQDRHGLTIEGNGTTIVARTDGHGAAPPAALAHRWPRRRSHVHVRDSSDIVIRDLGVHGPHEGGGWIGAELEGQMGFDLVNVERIRIENCRSQDTHGDAVYVQGADNVLVTGCEVAETGRQGMTVTRGRNITFAGNTLRRIGRSAFDLEPNLSYDVLRNIRIANNKVQKARLAFVAAHGRKGTLDDLEIVNNRVCCTSFLDITVDSTEGNRDSGVLITGNRASRSFGSPHAPMRFRGVDDVVIRDNDQALTAGRSGLAVQTWESCEVTVDGNDFANAVPPVVRGDSWDRCDPGPVARLYRAYFLRTPDKGGLSHWLDAYRSGRSLQSTSQFFAESAEFQARYGTLDESAFVSRLYRNTLDREPEQAGLRFWARELSSGARDRGEVMIGFSESAEHRARTRHLTTAIGSHLRMTGQVPRAKVIDEYLTSLGRGADLGDLGNQIRSGIDFALRTR